MIRGAVRGAGAGAAATVVMSALMLAAQRLGLIGEMPPEKITARFLDRLGVRRSGETQDVLAGAAHLGFGAAGGALFGALQRGTRLPVPPVLAGMAFGATVWFVSYQGWVPWLGIMPPADRDRPGRPQSMLIAHLAYGAVLGALLGRPRTRPAQASPATASARRGAAADARPSSGERHPS